MVLVKHLVNAVEQALRLTYLGDLGDLFDTFDALLFQIFGKLAAHCCLTALIVCSCATFLALGRDKSHLFGLSE